MNLNADFSLRVVQRPDAAHWTSSPEPGVERRMLDRVGGEIARATSIVRFAPGSRFVSHEHGGGEEILVLEGVFSDEDGDHPAGTYLRNPPGTRHAPYSRAGCTLFVKLWQFAPDDLVPVRIDTRSAPWQPVPVPGAAIIRLHEHGGVWTVLVRLEPNAPGFAHEHPGGEEIYVLAGTAGDEQGEYPAGTWLRNPCGSRHAPYAGPEGALLYVKGGHLAADVVRPQRGRRLA